MLHKPVKNTVFYLRNLVVLHNCQLMCIYEYEKAESGGFVELWSDHKAKATYKFDIVAPE